jgi:hypothetical protein
MEALSPPPTVPINGSTRSRTLPPTTLASHRRENVDEYNSLILTKYQRHSINENKAFRSKIDSQAIMNSPSKVPLQPPLLYAEISADSPRIVCCSPAVGCGVAEDRGVVFMTNFVPIRVIDATSRDTTRSPCSFGLNDTGSVGGRNVSLQGIEASCSESSSCQLLHGSSLGHQDGLARAPNLEAG